MLFLPLERYETDQLIINEGHMVTKTGGARKEKTSKIKGRGAEGFRFHGNLQGLGPWKNTTETPQEKTPALLLRDNDVFHNPLVNEDLAIFQSWESWHWRKMGPLRFP